MIELSEDDFAEAQRLMSVGRLVQGLIHNLNGPLQNLGMDMDMIGYALEGRDGELEELQEEVRTRIGRMEEEFEQVNRLIRLAASRLAPDAEQAFLSLGDFLEEEMAFLRSNLHFKHHVEKLVDLQEELPALKSLPESLPEGLRSLLEAVAFDMERREMTRFGLKASALETGTLLEVTAGKGSLSEPLLEGLRQGASGGGPRRISAEEMTVAHAGLMFARAGLSPEVEAGAEETRIRLVVGTAYS
jgi:hypothetical protein